MKAPLIVAGLLGILLESPAELVPFKAGLSTDRVEHLRSIFSILQDDWSRNAGHIDHPVAPFAPRFRYSTAEPAKRFGYLYAALCAQFRH